MVPLGLQNVSLIGRFLYYVLNSESPLREVPLYRHTIDKLSIIGRFEVLTNSGNGVKSM